MRVAIREQLSLVILLSSLIGLGVISIATWVRREPERGVDHGPALEI